MNYHNITHDDMNNGDGLRVVLWLSGCHHHCKGCQNPQTWNPNSGIPFDDEAKQEIFNELSKDYISGITFSGGDPLAEENVQEVYNLIKEIRDKFPKKTVWLYTGYELENVLRDAILPKDELSAIRLNTCMALDILVDGKYVESLRNVNLKWVGSSNQHVINIKSDLEEMNKNYKPTLIDDLLNGETFKIHIK